MTYGTIVNIYKKEEKLNMNDGIILIQQIALEEDHPQSKRHVKSSHDKEQS
jgi:hypothetical protein